MSIVIRKLIVQALDDTRLSDAPEIDPPERVTS